jgi:two-component SAPR family response regulator
MGLSLNLAHVSVDAEHLLQDAAHAARLLRSGDLDPAHEILTEVDARYRGDAFEDEPYEPWADGLREEARAAWLRSLRHLADIRAGAGEHQDAASLLVRMLVADPYDEPAHRGLVQVLVRTGRHGEARRAFDRWVGAMRSIDAPLPDPGVLRTAATSPASNSLLTPGRGSSGVAATMTRR